MFYFSTKQAFFHICKKLILSLPETDHILRMFLITYCENNRTRELHFIYLLKRVLLFSLPLFEFSYLLLLDKDNYVFMFIVMYLLQLLLNFFCTIIYENYEQNRRFNQNLLALSLKHVSNKYYQNRFEK